MKCGICGKTIEETFLKKPIGTYIQDKTGKRHVICFECQKRFRTKEELLKQLK